MTDQPRLMSGVDAATYCGVTPETFSKWVSIGAMPKAVIGRRWDRKAIDLALDKASGITAVITKDEANEAAEEAWKAKYAARKGAARNSDRHQNARGR